MSSGLDLHEINLVSSGKLKLRATALLAEGTADAVFRASVLLHEAARFERRAIEALSPCPPLTRLAASIEECWCLVEGRDPHSAADVWSRILEEAQEIDTPTKASLLSRLKPKYDQAIRGFAKRLQECPTLQIGKAGMLRGAGTMVPASPSGRSAALREVHNVLADYPGVSSFWALAAHLEDASENPRGSWDALQRAVALAPENQQFRALSLITAVEALPRSEADAHLAQVLPTLHKSSAEVCLMYAFAEIQLARSKAAGRAQRWQRALTAVNSAFPRTHSEGLRKNLTALQLFLLDMIAERAEDPDILYRAGLGGLAATRRGHLIDVLREDAAARVSAMEASDAAA